MAIAFHQSFEELSLYFLGSLISQLASLFKCCLTAAFRYAFLNKPFQVLSNCCFQVMSLTADYASGAAHKCAVILKTVDQYDMWKARVTDACWSATLMNVFDVTDEDCKAAISELEKKVPDNKHKFEWVGKCWTILTSSLHDELYRRVNHTPRGFIKSLLNEISHALVNNFEDVAPLRLELYGKNIMALQCKKIVATICNCGSITSWNVLTSSSFSRSL